MTFVYATILIIDSFFLSLQDLSYTPLYKVIKRWRCFLQRVFVLVSENVCSAVKIDYTKSEGCQY